MEKTEIPSIKWIRRNLKQNVVPFYGEVLNAFVVGSVARGNAGPDSDLDIAVIIKRQRGGISSIKFTDRYHSRIRFDSWKPKFNDRIVDFQFFYETDSELETYAKIDVPGA
jgi:predicted nucleotidyltransferase